MLKRQGVLLIRQYPNFFLTQVSWFCVGRVDLSNLHLGIHFACSVNMLNLLQIPFYQGPNLLENAAGSEQAFKLYMHYALCNATTMATRLPCYITSRIFCMV